MLIRRNHSGSSGRNHRNIKTTKRAKIQNRFFTAWDRASAILTNYAPRATTTISTVRQWVHHKSRERFIHLNHHTLYDPNAYENVLHAGSELAQRLRSVHMKISTTYSQNGWHVLYTRHIQEKYKNTITKIQTYRFKYIKYKFLLTTTKQIRNVFKWMIFFFLLDDKGWRYQASSVHLAHWPQSPGTDTATRCGYILINYDEHFT